jgi:hypothetical protein
MIEDDQDSLGPSRIILTISPVRSTRFGIDAYPRLPKEEGALGCGCTAARPA